jgi:myosin heavy subunit
LEQEFKPKDEQVQQLSRDLEETKNQLSRSSNETEGRVKQLKDEVTSLTKSLQVSKEEKELEVKKAQEASTTQQSKDAKTIADLERSLREAKESGTNTCAHFPFSFLHSSTFSTLLSSSLLSCTYNDPSSASQLADIKKELEESREASKKYESEISRLKEENTKLGSSASASAASQGEAQKLREEHAKVLNDLRTELENTKKERENAKKEVQTQAENLKSKNEIISTLEKKNEELNTQVDYLLSLGEDSDEEEEGGGGGAGELKVKPMEEAKRLSKEIGPVPGPGDEKSPKVLARIERRRSKLIHLTMNRTHGTVSRKHKHSKNPAKNRPGVHWQLEKDNKSRDDSALSSSSSSSEEAPTTRARAATVGGPGRGGMMPMAGMGALAAGAMQVKLKSNRGGKK